VALQGVSNTRNLANTRGWQNPIRKKRRKSMANTKITPGYAPGAGSTVKASTTTANARDVGSFYQIASTLMTLNFTEELQDGDGRKAMQKLKAMPRTRRGIRGGAANA
jgi:hypothetical protein